VYGNSVGLDVVFFPARRIGSRSGYVMAMGCGTSSV
jgi:hypothetical protein